MSDRSGDFEQALRRLRAEYRAELPARLDRIEAEIARARSEGAPEALRDARGLAHTLKGTSGSYGLDGVSRALLEVEEALDELLGGAQDPEGSWETVWAALVRAREQLAS